MKILEYGNPNGKKLILIHGFQMPLSIWEKYIEHYKNNFHIIVPIIHGHDPESKEIFIGFADTTSELEECCISNYGENIHAVYGMSMGGVLAAAIWQNKRLKINKLIMDGSPLLPSNALIRKYMQSFYLTVTHKAQKRDPKTLERSKNICPPKYLDDFLAVLDNMSDTTIANVTTAVTSFRLSETNDTSLTEIYYFHGTAANEMIAQKSAKFIAKHYPSAVIKCFQGKAHCENAIFHPDIMIKELDEIIM